MVFIEVLVFGKRRRRMLARVVMTWSCEDLPGFGVGVYSDIDPRARALLTITSKHIAQIQQSL